MGPLYTAASAIIANGHYYGGRFICASGACLDDNTFEVCLFLSAGPLAVLRYGLALVRGRLAQLPDFRVVRGTEIRIESPHGNSAGFPGTEPVQLDGDISCHLPLTIRPANRRLLLICGGGSPSR